MLGEGIIPSPKEMFISEPFVKGSFEQSPRSIVLLNYIDSPKLMAAYTRTFIKSRESKTWKSSKIVKLLKSAMEKSLRLATRSMLTSHNTVLFQQLQFHVVCFTFWGVFTPSLTKADQVIRTNNGEMTLK